MATQKQLDKVYMQNAVNMATLSHAVRKKVGCILVTPENLQIGAYNGQPSGWDNICEDVHTTDDPHFQLFEYLVTKNTVIHAELNTILHAARQGALNTLKIQQNRPIPIFRQSLKFPLLSVGSIFSPHVVIMTFAWIS